MRLSPASALTWGLSALGVFVLPWYMLEDGLTPMRLFGLIGSEVEYASAATAAAWFGRWWLWPPVLAVLIGLPSLMPGLSRRSAALLRGGAGALGLTSVIAQGWLIGIRGWNYPALEAAFGALPSGQFGIGLGGAAAFLAFLLMITDALALKGKFGGDRFVAGAVGIIVAAIAIFTIWPVLTILSQAFGIAKGETAAVVFAQRFFHAKVWGLECLVSRSACGVAWNTLALALSTALATTLLGLCFALIAIRTGFPFKSGLRLLTVLPIVTPPFVIGLGLILIFGRSGIVNQAAAHLFGVELGRWIYGFNGVWLAQVFSFTPTAFLVLIGIVQGISPTMEEAAQTLRASPSRTFNAVTLPLMMPGLANAFLIVFIESLADFGNPIVLGGSFGVLSTEIFFAVVGAQVDFGRAAALALILLLFALTAFLIQRFSVGSRSYVSMTGKGETGLAQGVPTWVRRVAYTVALPWAVLTVTVYALALAGGFVKIWGRDWTPTLEHFARAFAIDHGVKGIVWSGGAWSSLFTTIKLAAIAAPITAALGLLAAWLLTRQRFAGRTALEFGLMLSFCVPGTVTGVAYILTYNIPPLEITGTALILVLCFIFRNMPVGVRSGMATMSQLDKNLDEAAATLRASTFRALRVVILPLLKPAIITALTYSFVRAMTTVSAVIFLVSAQYEMATVFIINRVINGDYGLAIAYSTVLIVLMTAVIGLIQLGVGERRLVRREPSVPAKERHA
ncbi:MAG: iron ABC transporter permease [Rhizobiales bacterium PAR1]|nr:MAG: iron ABC transporter permease [Rhizobiales bacterium PAR1]